MVIWISWDIDIPQNLNSDDSFPRRKFENWALTICSPGICSPGPMLSPPTISFELHAKTAEDIALEKCNFHNFGSSVTYTLDWVKVTLYAYPVDVYPHTKLDGNRKNFLWIYGRMDWRTDTPEFQSIRSSPGNDLKIIVHDWQLRKKVLWIIIVSDDHVSFHWLIDAQQGKTWQSAVVWS